MTEILEDLLIVDLTLASLEVKADTNKVAPPLKSHRTW